MAMINMFSRLTHFTTCISNSVYLLLNNQNIFNLQYVQKNTDLTWEIVPSSNYWIFMWNGLQSITHLIHHNQALFFWTSCKKRKNLHGGHGTRMFICHKITRVLFLDVTVDTFYIALDNYTSNIIFLWSIVIFFFDQ